MRFERDDLDETAHCVFWVNRGSVAEKSWLTCATVAGGAALAWNHILDLRAVELRVPGGFFSSLLTLCYGSLHVLRYFVHWNWCIKAVCSTVLCCNSIVFCETASADRNGMAAPRLSKHTCSAVAPCESDCVLRIIVGRLQYCYIKCAI